MFSKAQVAMPLVLAKDAVSNHHADYTPLGLLARLFTNIFGRNKNNV